MSQATANPKPPARDSGTAVANGGWLRRFVRPRVGDTWEIKIPNHTKKVKRIGKINRIWIRSKDGRGEHGNVRRIFIHWYRLPKGRYSGITLKGLLKYGRLIQSNADRVAQEEARMERVRAKWSNAQVSEGGTRDSRIETAAQSRPSLH